MFAIDAACGGAAFVVAQNALEYVGDEAVFLEDGEFFRFLPGADEAGHDADLFVNIEGDAAFAGAIELSEDESVERGGFVEFLSLIEGVGASGGIDDEKCEVRCAGILLGDGAAYFSEFLH